MVFKKDLRIKETKGSSGKNISNGLLLNSGTLESTVTKAAGFNRSNMLNANYSDYNRGVKGWPRRLP
jgi:hypothetical protein